jgi:hypothetical protein
LTTLPHKIIHLGNVDELKKIVGASDDQNDDHITYPEPTGIAPSTAKKDLSNDQIHHLKKLTHSYVFGNSSKISKDDVALINNAVFPTKVGAYSAQLYFLGTKQIIEIT